MTNKFTIDDLNFVRAPAFNSPIDDMGIWIAASSGPGGCYSFVITHESRTGPGFRGWTGYVASWRPQHRNGRGAIKIIGSPFKTFAEAEHACNAMLKHLWE